MVRDTARSVFIKSPFSCVRQPQHQSSAKAMQFYNTLTLSPLKLGSSNCVKQQHLAALAHAGIPLAKIIHYLPETSAGGRMNKALALLLLCRGSPSTTYRYQCNNQIIIPSTPLPFFFCHYVVNVQISTTLLIWQLGEK